MSALLPSPSLFRSTLTATSPIAAGTGTSTITVTAKDGFGNAIAGATGVLAATGTGNTLTQPGGATNASGEATGTVRSDGGEAKTVAAAIKKLAVKQTASVTAAAG